MNTDHEARAREIINWTVSEGTRDFSALHAAIATALREAEAPLLKKIVELSAQIQRMEEINENLRSAVRDQPIKWNDEYYEMKLKEARLTEREACAKVADNALGYGGVPCKQAAALIRSRSTADERHD